MKRKSLLIICALSLGIFSMTACSPNPKISDDAEMTAFSWSHNNMDRSDCYSFALFIQYGEPKISARYFDSETGEDVEKEALPIEWIEWYDVENFIRTASLSVYKKPLFRTEDYFSNTITVKWNREGKEKEITYGEGNSSGLYFILNNILENAVSNAEKQNNRAVEDTAVLTEFSWNQSSSVSYQCFNFYAGNPSFRLPDGKKYLNCQFTDSEHEIIQITDAELTDGQWKTLEDYLRKPAVSDLPQYTAPSSYMLDGDDSCIAVKWTENGESFTNLYNGQNANEFWTFITEFACEIKENSAE